MTTPEARDDDFSSPDDKTKVRGTRPKAGGVRGVTHRVALGPHKPETRIVELAAAPAQEADPFNLAKADDMALMAGRAAADRSRGVRLVP